MNIIRKQWDVIAIAFLVILKNWLLEAIPFVTREPFIHDDGLFMRQATQIVSGNWLGDFNHYNLIKGPIYPLWVAANYYIGISIIHTQDFLYLVACLVTTRAIHTDIKNKFALVAIFTALYLNPVSFDFLSISHGFRMVIYTSLTLLVFGSLLGLHLRLWRPSRGFYGWSLLFGVTVSLFWYTREEGIWIIPGVCFITITNSFIGIHRRDWRTFGKILLGFVIIPAAVWAATTGLLTYINWKNYNAPYVVEVMTPNFTRAYNALLSIEPDEFRRYYPVRAKTMERLMTISPKAAELTAFKGREDFAAAMFIWAFRDAVSFAGYYKKGAQAVDQYYANLADEIEENCRNGTLKCRKLFLSDCPPWQPVYTREFFSVLRKQIKEVVRFKDFSMSQKGHYSIGDDKWMQIVTRLTHARVQYRYGEYATDPKVFFVSVEKFKMDLLQKIGNAQLVVRPFLFYPAFLAMILLLFHNIRTRHYNPYTLFAISVAGSILTLSIGLTIIELTAYDSLFRARHGIYPLPPLYIIIVILALVYDRQNGYHGPRSPADYGDCNNADIVKI